MRQDAQGDFNRADVAMTRLIRDAREAARLLHPVYGYDWRTIPEAKADELADRLDECAAYLRLAIARAEEARRTRMNTSNGDCHVSA